MSVSAPRVLIAGGPRVGKTTLGHMLALLRGVELRSTDALIDTLAWSDASAQVARWIEEPGPYVIEGVAVARAIRKWLTAHPEGAPCDEIVLLTVPRVPLTRGQAAMAKGHDTVWREIAPELARRGVARL